MPNAWACVVFLERLEIALLCTLYEACSCRSAKVLMIKIFYEAWEIRRKDIHTRPYKNYIKILAPGPFSGAQEIARSDMRETAAALHNFIALAGIAAKWKSKAPKEFLSHSTLCNLHSEFQINF